jgi:hypothetical protein
VEVLAVPVGIRAFQAAAPSAGSPPAPVRLTSEEDHQRVMGLLHIAELRPGKNGSNRDSPSYANYDESKANPYPNLPDPLLLKSGKKVTTAAMWWNQRRPEIVEDFDREVYGRVPKNVPKVSWRVVSFARDPNGGVPIVTRQIVGHVDNSIDPQIAVDIQLTVSTPANAKGPVPVIMVFGGGFGPGLGAGRGAAPAPTGPPYGPNAFATPPAARGTLTAAPGGAVPGRGALTGRGVPGALAGRGPTGPTWQQQALAKGWGYASINTGSIQADNGAGLTLGIIGLVNKGQPRKLDDWGVLRAWAWGASRALDYFATDKTVNAKRVAVEGHSRWGKAALVAMAYDQRFWTAYVSSSGEGGAKLNRRNWGEIVENVAATSEYHWMAGNFLKYAGPLHWDDLPVDSHELVAMCAPRPVFLSAGKSGYDAEPGGDSWQDAEGTFMAGAAAGPVYKLLGKKDMGTTAFPKIETPLVDGDVAFRQHAGGHTDVPNWPTFLAFAERYVK